MSRFAPRQRSDVADMIRQEVLGLVTTHDAHGFISTPLPLLAELDEEGEVRALVGHFARANPHVARAEATPRALISFFGPHGYISPMIVSKPDWGPTWNYRLAQFEVDIDFAPEAACGDDAIRRLAEAMEGSGDDAWSVSRMGPRYARLLQQIVAFRAPVIRSTARFKLGQDEDRAIFDEIVGALQGSDLAQAMLDQRRSEADGFD